MKPFDLKKLSERRVELMARLEGMVSTCQMETRAFNEEERASYSKILDEVRFVVEIRFSGNVENNLLNEFQHDKSPFRPYVFLFFLMLSLKIPAP